MKQPAKINGAKVVQGQKWFMQDIKFLLQINPLPNPYG
jgi:hypothetical protein